MKNGGVTNLTMKNGSIIAGWWLKNHLEKYESQWEKLSHILWKI